MSTCRHPVKCPARQAPGVPSQDRNLQFKTPGSKQNLAYPCLGAYLATVKVREPQNSPLGGRPGPWSSLLRNAKTSPRNKYTNQTGNLSWQPPPIPLYSNTNQSAGDSLEKNGVKGKFSKFPESRLPPSNVYEPDMTRAAQCNSAVLTAKLYSINGKLKIAPSVTNIRYPSYWSHEMAYCGVRGTLMNYFNYYFLFSNLPVQH